jgi:hypothetical protein
MANLSIGTAGSSYFDYAYRAQAFCAYATITAPVIYSTAAGTGGPLLWNGTTNRNAIILGVSCALSVVSTVAAALGLTGNSGQTAAPTATTPITSAACLRIGNSGPQCQTYSVGTVTNAGNFFLPLIGLGTGALTVDEQLLGFIDLAGMIVVPPNCWVSIAASATALTTVASIGLVWAEQILQ